MPNDYFQFKQFRIQQDACAMKVSTDACIQGAWTPIAGHVKRIMDIGAGTGLLSLMLAQRSTSDVLIDAVELDEAAAQQAKENIAVSQWSERITVVHGDVTVLALPQQYDMVICNPPFFNNSLQGEDAQRNMARHTNTLGYAELLEVLDAALDSEGYASILLPVAEYEVWKRLLSVKGWCITNELWVQPTGAKPANRVVSVCSRMQRELVTEELCIYNADRTYTGEFTTLLGNYYLAL
jgi:tRNA1Val (adenine37-N6)-methyltransferase